jgi:pimeloyl-ACP methyl ester carboxylesterase
MTSASSTLNSTTVRPSKPMSLNLGKVLAPVGRIVAKAGMTAASAVAPHWAVRTASRLFLTPPRFAHTSAELVLLATGVRHDIATSSGRIAAWQFGDASKPAIIASHGWGGRGAQFRSFVPALLDAGFQVWLLDHIGHGLSDGKEASLVDFASGVNAVHRRIEQNGAIVHGMLSHSLGGAGIATALRGFARTAPVTVKRVVMIAPPSSLMRYSRFFARYIGIPERIREAMQWRFEQRYGVKWNEFEMPHAVSGMKAPALVIHDADDREVTPESGLMVARSWPDARLVRTRGLGHRRILKDNGVVQDTVDFMLDTVTFPQPQSSADWELFPGPAPLF